MGEVGRVLPLWGEPHTVDVSMWWCLFGEHSTQREFLFYIAVYHTRDSGRLVLSLLFPIPHGPRVPVVTVREPRQSIGGPLYIGTAGASRG